MFVKYKPCCENRSSAFTLLVNFAVSVVINNTSDRHNAEFTLMRNNQSVKNLKG